MANWEMKLGVLDPHHREFQVNMGVFDVFRTTKILRRPGPKCRSISRGRRRFYVTSHRIFVVREDFFERTMLGNETVVTHISKPAQFETGEPDHGPTEKMFLSFIIAINMLIWHWSQNVTIQMTFARNWRNMCKWRTKWSPCRLSSDWSAPYASSNAE